MRDPNHVRYDDLNAKVFPANRETRVLAGTEGLPAERFVMGYVEVQPGGEVPVHDHPQEEVYFVLEGHGQVVVGAKTYEMKPLSAVYIPSDAPHHLVNTGETMLKFVFTYAPGGVVSHWAHELGEAGGDAQ